MERPMVGKKVNNFCLATLELCQDYLHVFHESPSYLSYKQVRGELVWVSDSTSTGNSFCSTWPAWGRSLLAPNSLQRCFYSFCQLAANPHTVFVSHSPSHCRLRWGEQHTGSWGTSAEWRGPEAAYSCRGGSCPKVARRWNWNFLVCPCPCL